MSLFPLSGGSSFGFGLGGIDRGLVCNLRNGVGAVCSGVSAFLLLVTGFPLLPYSFVWVGALKSRDIILSLSLVGSTVFLWLSMVVVSFEHIPASLSNPLS
ncbi:hypothetical protein CICLE_v10007154mg [Citrus x clementina]|uniref:Uncharacterized protein n=1 Tax=Citrus clementina TaxID=85681 RepID=V4RGP9_CITCL|nr:hypothetical protein CICLE_v10007154mg [Citrus x clementina]